QQLQGQPPLPGGIGLLEPCAGVHPEAERPAVRRWTDVPLADRTGMGIYLSGRAYLSSPERLPLLLRPVQDRPHACSYERPFFHPGELRRQLPSRLGRERAVPPTSLRRRLVFAEPARYLRLDRQCLGVGLLRGILGPVDPGRV